MSDDFTVFPNTPLDFDRIDFMTTDNEIDINIAESQFNQGFDLLLDDSFLTGRSNDFNSSAGITVQQTPQTAIIQGQEIKTNQKSQKRVVNPLISLSPVPTIETTQKIPKSTDFVIEPEVFGIKSRKKPSSRLMIGLSKEDHEFYAICSNPEVTISPKQLGFIPSTYWPDGVYKFGDIAESYFRLKNNINARFPQKVFNALQISTKVPSLARYVGISWVNDYVIRVDSVAFARLLGIKAINGSLFHSQGNFPSHGFVIFSSVVEASQHVPLEVAESVDYDKVRLLYHQAKLFVKGSTESDIEKLQWLSVKMRNQ